MNLIISLLVNAVAFYLGSKLLSGVTIKNFLQAVILALVIAVLNVTLGFLLKIVTLGLLALGIFSWILTAILIQVADYFLKDVHVKNFWWALGLAAVVAIINALIYWVLPIG